LPVNPIHVLDLALVLPAMAATGVLLWMNRPPGFLFAVPLLMFGVAMDIAIIAMAITMVRNRVSDSYGPAVFIGVLLFASTFLLLKYLKGPGESPGSAPLPGF
jgi:hypothetical protein